MRSAIGPAIKFLVALLVLYLLVASGLLEPEVVLRAFRENPGYLAMAIACYFLLTLVAGARWFLLMRAVGLEISLPRTFSLHMIGLFFSLMLPGGAGGDLVKGYYLFRHQQTGRRALALTSVAMDRAVGIYGLIVMGVIVILLNLDRALSNNYLRINTLFYLALFIGATVVIALLLSPLRGRLLSGFKHREVPGKQHLAALADSLKTYANRKKTLALALVLTLLVHGGLTLVFYLILLSLDLDLGYRDNAFVVPLLTLINNIPLSPGGIGISEAAGEVLYRIMGLADAGSEILALFHVCLAVTSLLGLPFYLVYRSYTAPSIKETGDL